MECYFLANVTRAFLGWLEDTMVRTEAKRCLLLFRKRENNFILKEFGHQLCAPAVCETIVPLQ